MRIDSYPSDGIGVIDLRILETARLRISPVRADREIANDLFTLYANQEASRFNLWVPAKNPEEVRERMEQAEEEWREGKKFKWLLFHKKALRFIGDFTLVKFDMRWKEVEIGFNLSPEFWKMGLMSEVLDKMIPFIILDLGLERIVANVQSENTASLMLLGKSGFRVSGEHFHSLIGTKGYGNLKILSLNKIDWVRKEVTFSKYTDDLKDVFKNLHTPWLEEYGYLDEIELSQLENPSGTILKNGGEIYFMHHRDEIVGSASLKYIAENQYELVKMAVKAEYRGYKFGKILLEFIIAESKKKQCKILELYTHPQLKQAIKLYEQAGFKYADIPCDDRYAGRCELRMVLALSPANEN